MTQTARKKMGRPSKPPVPGTRVSLSFRVTPELKLRMEAAAAESGRSIAQETELRLTNSFDRVESHFGGKQGLSTALMLFANFKFAGDNRAKANGHPEWTIAEWLADPDCFEQALKQLVRSVWEQHPGPGTNDDLLRWLQNLFNSVLSRKLTEQYNAKQEAAAEQTPNAA